MSEAGKLDCHELIARLPVSEEQFDLVDDAVPERFRVLRDPFEFDRAHRVLRSSVCQKLALTTGDGDPGPGLQAQLGVEIQSPDGVQNLDHSFGCCDWYTLFWVTDDRDVAAWLKESSGLGAGLRSRSVRVSRPDGRRALQKKVFVGCGDNCYQPPPELLPP